MCRKSAFDKCDIGDGIGVEHGEEAEQVVGIIDRDPIQQDEVLVGASSPDVHTTGSLGT